MSGGLSFTTYFAELSALAARLGRAGITVAHSEYHMRAFGSWVLEVERGHRCTKVVWDGKDGCLSVSVGSRPDSGAHIQWQRLPDQRLPNGDYSEIFIVAEKAVHEGVGT